MVELPLLKEALPDERVMVWADKTSVPFPPICVTVFVGFAVFQAVTTVAQLSVPLNTKVTTEVDWALSVKKTSVWVKSAPDP